MRERENAINAKPTEVRRLLADVFATSIGEQQCDEVSAPLVLCAEALLDDQQAAQQYPVLFRHFRFCPDCRTEYDLLVQLVQMQKQRQVARPRTIPAMPVLPTIVAEAGSQRLFNILFPGFVPAVAGASVRGDQSFNFLPVTVSLGDHDEYQIKFDVIPSSTQPTLRTLFCTIASNAPSLFATDAHGWLEVGDNPIRQQEQPLSDTGEIVFDELAPNRYHLHLHWLDQEYVINAIEIP